MIRYLSQEEKNRTRALYEANFPEDSVEFVDYYYSCKTADNRILVMEDAGEPEVMIHLNPYTFKVCGHSVLVNYIVAVATEASVRRQGKMRAVMKRALRDMAREHQPFTFLIPANPAVYRSDGFVFVDSEADDETARGIRQKEKDISTFHELSLRRANAADIPAMVRFANTFLDEEYDIFPEHTEAYYHRMMAEMECQNGGIILLVRARTSEQELPSDWEGMSERELPPDWEGLPEQLIGIFSYGRENRRTAIQELLVKREYRKKMLFRIREGSTRREDGIAGKQFFAPFTEQKSPLAIDTMNFMFRILDLRALVPLLRSREPYALRVQVEDRMLPENTGAYEILLDRAGSTITCIPVEETECSMDITELTCYLFGKMKIFIREWV